MPVISAPLVVDLRNNPEPAIVTVIEVRRQANLHFWGNESGLLKDGHDGTFLGNNMTHLYHVQSVANNLWVCATHTMSPDETRSAARDWVAAHPLK